MKNESRDEGRLIIYSLSIIGDERTNLHSSDLFQFFFNFYSGKNGYCILNIRVMECKNDCVIYLGLLLLHSQTPTA